MKRKQLLFLLLVTLLIASMACSLVGGAIDAGEGPAVEEPSAEGGAAESPIEDTTPEEETAEESQAEEAPEPVDEGQEFDTEFPLPDDVQNFTKIGEQVNFATSLTVEEAIEFYRDALTGMGLTERTINTAITETTFSMVFDGHESGKAVVIQGVDLDNGTTNINIRFEDV
ncbi:MAG: hypothetical protein FJ010_09920 [Chloroflexi bacterium]|nr:hypothetical protein [Chloroflexota bacterium]